MARHRKPSRVRLPHPAPGAAAAPTLAGVAAAFCLTPQAPAAPPAAQAAAQAVAQGAVQAVAQGAVQHAGVPNAYQRGMAPAQLLSAIGPATRQQPDADLPAWYTVRPGDSLSAIAGQLYRNPAAWPVLYWRNHGQVRWADIIKVGQVLRIPAEPGRIPRPPALLAQPVSTAVAYTPRHAAPAPVPAQAAPVHAPPAHAAQVEAQAAAPAASTYSGGIPGGAFGQCVVARESGGQAQIMNSTGHYGLYQFSASTWAEYGGNPADFGHASVAEQSQVFANALARGGQFNWSPYDGC